MNIFTLDTITDENQKNDLIEQIKNIFYLSSSLKEFSSPERKIAFFKRWCGDYITLYPEEFFIVTDKQSPKKVLGYLSGCADSTRALTVLEVPGFEVFSELFSEYPAHLHINFHPDARGKGLGSKLVLAYADVLKKKNIHGLHLVTSPEAANIPFYERLGFDHQVRKDFNQMKLLFMGKILD